MLNDLGKELQEEFEKSEEMCGEVVELFQLMANKQRFRIICILRRGDFCVNEIAEILGTEKVSNISQQLKVLRLAGVIRSRREEKFVVYSLADRRLRKVMDRLREIYGQPEAAGV